MRLSRAIITVYYSQTPASVSREIDVKGARSLYEYCRTRGELFLRVDEKNENEGVFGNGVNFPRGEDKTG